MAPEYIEHRLMGELDANVLKRPLNSFGTPDLLWLTKLPELWPPQIPHPAGLIQLFKAHHGAA
jgi:hypothetical protein